MTTNNADLQQHARQLADAFGLKLQEVPGFRICDSRVVSLTWRTTSVHSVHVPPIETEFIYAVALHEMGHVLHPAGQVGGSAKLQLHAEESAWSWAQHYALRWTDEMQRALRLGLETYELECRVEQVSDPVEQQRMLRAYLLSAGDEVLTEDLRRLRDTLQELQLRRRLQPVETLDAFMRRRDK